MGVVWGGRFYNRAQAEWEESGGGEGGGVVWGGMGRDFKIVHKLNGGSLGGWYSLLPATNFCSE